MGKRKSGGGSGVDPKGKALKFTGKKNPICDKILEWLLGFL